MLQLYRSFLSTFVRPEHLSTSSVLNLDFTDSAVLKSPSFVTICEEALAAINQKVERRAFRENVQKVYTSTAKYMREKLPLENEALPARRSVHSTRVPEVTRLAQIY